MHLVKKCFDYGYVTIIVYLPKITVYARHETMSVIYNDPFWTVHPQI